MAERDLQKRMPRSRERPTENPDMGFVWEDTTGRVVGLYGSNPTRDACTLTVYANGETHTLKLDARAGRGRVDLPARLGLTVARDEKDRFWHVEGHTKIVTERVFAVPEVVDGPRRRLGN